MRWLERLLDRSTPVRAHRMEAQGWDTCAVGEVVKDFPSVVLVNLEKSAPRTREPKDKYLERLGVRFAKDISVNDRTGALKTYDRIQARVRTLIRKAKAAA